MTAEDGGPAAPAGLQLDILSLVLRLDQILDELDNDREELAWFLLDRVVRNDLPRLRGHLTPETVAWADAHGEFIGQARDLPSPRRLGGPGAHRAPRRRWLRAVPEGDEQ